MGLNPNQFTVAGVNLDPSSVGFFHGTSKPFNDTHIRSTSMRGDDHLRGAVYDVSSPDHVYTMMGNDNPDPDLPHLLKSNRDQQTAENAAWSWSSGVGPYGRRRVYKVAPAGEMSYDENTGGTISDARKFSEPTPIVDEIHMPGPAYYNEYRRPSMGARPDPVTGVQGTLPGEDWMKHVGNQWALPYGDEGNWRFSVERPSRPQWEENLEAQGGFEPPKRYPLHPQLFGEF